MSDEEKRAKQRAATARYRARLKAQGIDPHTRTDEQRAAATKRAAKYRAEAHARGEKLPSETWWQRNRDKHRTNIARWRDNNIDRARELGRNAQLKRRSTPWGQINNNMWPLMHGGISNLSSRWGVYNKALGYRWIELRLHIAAQFDSTMNWGNWGDVWEIDHIIPLSSFQYTSIDDPLFKQAWALSNLRPLCRIANAAKGKKIITEDNKQGTTNVD